MQSPLPSQIVLLAERARGLLKKARDEQSLEKVRDLLLEIGDTLDVMIDAASAADNGGNGSNADLT